MQLLSAIILVVLIFFSTGCVQDHLVVSAQIVYLQWYMHDTPYSGPNSSSIPVTGSNGSDFQTEVQDKFFGQIFVFDDPLTLGPSPQSASFGRAQGTYTYVSREEFVSYVSYTVSIRSGVYNGSTLNILGASQYLPGNKYAIVGGTGDFILARGILKEVVVNLFGNASATLSHHATVYLE
ncbi:hypothetical protein O6H91_11G036100 [Diphasiastrum complanatum]|uniref:Uncharacterized protein n=2 Tax=Diphasiastrum complanatum TaxID=34168 RepID=A0ACC2C801_DIPCM|nr:hypothetical protein O6H91_11G035800 [Diphasiastrum complanatum]KAJ7538148.1 hypothetical protein O6H91_11G036100 [Diphasiastrum complanatum]